MPHTRFYLLHRIPKRCSLPVRLFRSLPNKHREVHLSQVYQHQVRRSTNMTQEKPLEELIYELGNGSQMLALHKLASRGTLEFHDVNKSYEDFKERASKLGVQLPHLPVDKLSEKFLDDQIIKVEDYIKLHKTESMFHLFLMSFAAERFLQSLALARKMKYETPEEGRSKLLALDPHAPNQCLQKFITQAKEAGLDMGDQLEKEMKGICDNYMNLKFDQALENSIRERLKKKLCGPRTEKSKLSEVDPDRLITDDDWAISLVRLPDSSNEEHAFLVLEGKEGTKSKIWFADFVPEYWFDAYIPGKENGEVRMEYHEAELGDPTARLLFKCEKKMMNVGASDRLLYSTWRIDKTTADKLIKMIEEKEKNPPKFHILGDSALAASSATSSSNPTGHNCFTFAKMMLRDLNDPYIELLQNGLDNWVVSATCRYLADKQFTRRKWYKTWSFQLMFGFLPNLVVVFFVLKAFNTRRSLPNKHREVHLSQVYQNQGSRSTNMTQEKTVKELIYELGNGAQALVAHQLASRVTLEFHVEKDYEDFRERASKLGVQLPHLPVDELSEKFLDDQIIKVRDYIKLHKTESMFHLFAMSFAAERFLRSLYAVSTVSYETPEEGRSKLLALGSEGPNQCLQDLITQAKVFGIDMSDQLKVDMKGICDDYMNLKFDQVLENSIRVRLKKELCGYEFGNVESTPPAIIVSRLQR